MLKTKQKNKKRKEQIYKNSLNDAIKARHNDFRKKSLCQSTNTIAFYFPLIVYSLSKLIPLNYDIRRNMTT